MLHYFDTSTIFWLLAIFPGSSIATLSVLYIIHFVRGERKHFFEGVTIKEYLYIWFLRPLFSISIGIIFYTLLVAISVPALSPLSSTFWQFVVLYVLFELSLFMFHCITHRYKVFSFLHKEHHEIKTIHWTNSALESWAFEVVIVLIYVFWLYVLQVPVFVYALTIIFWKIMLAITHYSVPFSFWVGNFIFVSPAFHLQHHINGKRSTGLTMSLFDHIYEVLKMMKRKWTF